jgi:hypothetical protein
MNVLENVKLELTEMKKLGLRVPAKAIKYVEANPAEIEEYRESGMRISEIADLIIDLV